jgi:hypothetical protein
MRRLAWLCALALTLGCTETETGTPQDTAPADTVLADSGPKPSADAATLPDQSAPDEDAASKPKAPIFITTMTHLEGNWDYGGNNGEKKFELDVKKIHTAMDTFDAHGALLTIESEIPFSTMAKKVQSDIFDQLMARGHGVGTHCDITPDVPVIPTDEFSQEFVARKTLMDDLVGAENNLGCSGGQGRNDWIAGAHLAGFKFIDGVVGFGYLSMDEDKRPEGWTDDYILKEGHYHDNIPVDLAERIHPFMMDDATDMVPDVPGKVLMSSGGLGRLDSFADQEEGIKCNPNCTLEDKDVDAVFKRIDEALAVHDSTRVGKVDIYFPLSIFKSGNLPHIDTFLARLKTDYIDTGKLTWTTQRGVYESYVAWNKPD